MDGNCGLPPCPVTSCGPTELILFPPMNHRLRNVWSGARALLGILSGARVLGGPRSVALSLSDVCDARCMMCWFHSPLAAQGSVRGSAGDRAAFMEPDRFETIIRQCRSMGTWRVVLCGNGEPALHPAFDRMLEQMRELGMVPYVITNGLALDSGRAVVWSRIPAHFRFSLQAGDPETWCRVHAGGTPADFERVSAAMRVLAQSGTPHVSALHVIHRQNYRTVRAMIEHARALGVGQVIFRPVRAEGPLADVILDEDEESVLREELAASLRLAAGYGIRTNIREYLADNLHVRAGRLDTAGVYAEVPCYVGWLYAEFGIDGAVVPCIGSEREMGNVCCEPFRAIWRSPQYRAFRREARSMPQRGEPVRGCTCRACPMYKYNVNMHAFLRLRWREISDA